MCGHAKPQDPSPAVTHDQESVEQSERHSRHDEQVHRGNAVCMITKKRLPALRRRSPRPRHVLGYAGLAYIDPELEQFTVDPRGSPQRVRNAHFADQLAEFRRYGGADRASLDFQRQYDRKPARCQRITVSGRMMASASRVFGNNPQIQPRTNRSLAENGNRPSLPRRSTMICCRSTRISASSAARDRNRSRTRPKIGLMRPNIQASVARFSAPRQPDSIYDSDRYQEEFLPGPRRQVR